MTVESTLELRLSGPKQTGKRSPGGSSPNPVYLRQGHGGVLHTANLNKANMQLLGLDDNTDHSLVLTSIHVFPLSNPRVVDFPGWLPQILPPKGA
jgi:hypothetical protein